MTNDTEPRALSAALAAPAFVTRSHGATMHAANRHVERWAPEVTAGRVRSMHALGFVDRLVAPWMETAQRSASQRLFDDHASTSATDHAPRAVSWVFPRPWFQDELDWMAAARQVHAQVPAPQAAPTLLTTRGTYVPPASAVAAPRVQMPSALYEYVAPSLSLAAQQRPQIAGTEPGARFGGRSPSRSEPYSPLIPLAAVHAAALMARAMAPLSAMAPAAAGALPAERRGITTTVTPGLRSMVSSMLARASTARADLAPTRLSQIAPALVTPPAPRPDDAVGAVAARGTPSTSASSAAEIAEQYAEQRARIAELSRLAQREAVARGEAVPPQASQPVSATAAPEIHAAAERAERELRQRASAAEAQRRGDAAQGAQRLHAQARTEAAAHARAADSTAAAPAGAVPVAAVARAVSSPEMLAAIAGLPPALSALIGSTVGQRPETAVQAIGELGEALRAVELLARSSASGAAFEVTRGPRLVMPAGLGGLVSAIDRAPAVADRPGARPWPLLASAAQVADATQPRASRVPLMPWLVPAGAASAELDATGSTTALGATAAASPAALAHVAWADRWLARFAGATPRSLHAMTAAASSPAARLQALAQAAPDAVFVAPELRGDPAAPQARRAAEPLAAPAMQLVESAASREPLRRFDDDAETPDDVFAAISAAATRGRGAPRRAEPAARPAVAAAPVAIAERASAADLIAHAAPGAPGAGLSAQLASSPFAPVLRHVLALPSAASFDVRSLFGADLGVAYLAGLIGPGVQGLAIGSQAAPTWASWSEAPLGRAGVAEREVAGFDAAYVAPVSPDRALSSVAPDARDAGDAGLAAPLAPPAIADSVAAVASAPGAAAALTTLRSALLAWPLTPASEPGAPQFAPAGFAAAAAGPRDRPADRSSSPARSMIEAMTLPMLSGSAEPQATTWAGPGMVADRAHSWAVAQERSSSDLALDFVAPELVLAARVYGLGPAEAAQAARLAVAGAGQLGAMANTVDRTFVAAMAIGREARSLESGRRAALGEPGVDSETFGASAPRATVTTAFPTAAGDLVAAMATPVGAGGLDRAAGGATPAIAGPAPSGALFGVGRGTPRGAFLWPSAAVAALGLTALGSDGQLSMSVAALELLAAQVVAELGTYTALSEVDAARGGARRGTAGSGSPVGGDAPGPATGRPGELAPLAAGPRGAPEPVEPVETDVLGAAAAFVPAARRARFEALYVALGQSAAGRSWSPAARAARALALAGRGEDGPATARERASAAWDVLPVVYAGAFDGAPAAGAPGGEASVASTSAASAAAAMMGSYVAPTALGSRAGRGRAMADGEAWSHVTVAPGLSGLSARAGEALGAYVAPAAPPSAPRERDAGAMSRPPSAAPEYVQTRSGGRHGGGEVEIPPWFEAAALKMLSERSGNEGISLAELTLINAAPAHQIAASTRAAPSAAPPGPPSAAGATPSAASQIDVDKVASDVYRQILIMMDAARARNGEPYL